MPHVQGYEGYPAARRVHGADGEEKLATEDGKAVSRGGRYLKPGWFVGRVVNLLLMRLGMIPTLAVRGRTSGEWRTVPVNVLELDGQRYLVAPRGDTQWVRNLRATGRGELRWRGRVEPFRAIEIPDDEKPRVIAAYLARWGYQVKGYFKTLPNAADHPVFQIERLSGVDSNVASRRERHETTRQRPHVLSLSLSHCEPSHR
jgi:deazaflavin-dependent oxidoreductase (nitroreductase family)